ncbi:hypothetical protein BC628DRAFT_801678 [Trametes gibbosa]|nr:hypothetical protein BC628DRAFT_801678 [Trametes gibbosa]
MVEGSKDLPSTRRLSSEYSVCRIRWYYIHAAICVLLRTRVNRSGNIVIIKGASCTTNGVVGAQDTRSLQHPSDVTCYTFMLTHHSPPCVCVYKEDILCCCSSVFRSQTEDLPLCGLQVLSMQYSLSLRLKISLCAAYSLLGSAFFTDTDYDPYWACLASGREVRPVRAVRLESRIRTTRALPCSDRRHYRKAVTFGWAINVKF